MSPRLIRALVARRVGGGVPGGRHAQPRFWGRMGQEIDPHLRAHERTAPPGFGDMAKQPRFDLVPLARPRGPMPHAYVPPGRVAQPWPGHRPPPGTTAVAAPARSGHQDVLGRGVQRLPPPRPPRLHRCHGKRRRIMIDADAAPAPVLRHRGDAGGDRWAPTLVQKGRPPHGLGPAWGVICTPPVGHVSTPRFVLGIDRAHRRAARLNILDRRVAGRQWRLAVRRRRPLASVPGAWQPVVKGLAPLPHGGVTHVMALLPQCRGHAARTFTGPAQGRQRITPSRRLHAGLDGLEELLLRSAAGLTPCPVASPTARRVTRVRPACQRRWAQPSRAVCQSCRPSDRRHAPMPQTARLGGRPPAARACVQLERERLICRVDRLSLCV